MTCSFCGKPEQEVFYLIVGPRVYICDECVELCNGAINGHILYLWRREIAGEIDVVEWVMSEHLAED